MYTIHITIEAPSVTDRAGIQPKPALSDFGLQPYVALMCRLMVSTP